MGVCVRTSSNMRVLGLRYGPGLGVVTSLAFLSLWR